MVPLLATTSARLPDSPAVRRSGQVRNGNDGESVDALEVSRIAGVDAQPVCRNQRVERRASHLGVTCHERTVPDRRRGGSATGRCVPLP